jgi:hypothetical protein
MSLISAGSISLDSTFKYQYRNLLTVLLGVVKEIDFTYFYYYYDCKIFTGSIRQINCDFDCEDSASMWRWQLLLLLSWLWQWFPLIVTVIPFDMSFSVLWLWCLFSTVITMTLIDLFFCDFLTVSVVITSRCWKKYAWLLLHLAVTVTKSDYFDWCKRVASIWPLTDDGIANFTYDDSNKRGSPLTVTRQLWIAQSESNISSQSLRK